MTEITYNEKELKKIKKEIEQVQHHIFMLKDILKLRCSL